MTDDSAQPVAQKPIPFTEFLTSVPVLQWRSVQANVQHNPSTGTELEVPSIQLFCPSPTCLGIRFFDAKDLRLYRFDSERVRDEYVYYSCRNCAETSKTYAIRMSFDPPNKLTHFMKLGEHPAYGDPRPNLVKDVLDDEIEFFERGYRSETAGLGIGAFAYYRRFVESHKNKIIAEIRNVAVAQGAKQDVIETLDKAAKMNSFENAVKTVKDAMPDSLRHSGGHNPLTLLHDALSAGLHNEDDEQCLELAKDIRLLLTDLAERTTQALKNNSELGQAVNRLLKKATARASGQP